nr:hypothetical protein [Candidatus Mycoplasma haematolamae]
MGAGSLKMVACAMVGGGLFTTGVFGVERAVRGGGGIPQPIRRGLSTVLKIQAGELSASL